MTRAEITKETKAAVVTAKKLSDRAYASIQKAKGVLQRARQNWARANRNLMDAYDLAERAEQAEERVTSK